MNYDDILHECIARRKEAPDKSIADVVAEVMDEVSLIKAELVKRPEFSLPVAELSAAIKKQ